MSDSETQYQKLVRDWLDPLKEDQRRLRSKDVNHAPETIHYGYGGIAKRIARKYQADIDLRYKQVVSTIRTTAQEFGMEAGDIYLTRESEIYVEMNISTHRLIISQGFLDKLDESEKRAILEHEYTHLVNGSLSFFTIMAEKLYLQKAFSPIFHLSEFLADEGVKNLEKFESAVRKTYESLGVPLDWESDTHPSGARRIERRRMAETRQR